MKTLLKGRYPAFAWLLFTTILLVLPGSAFPEETWLSKIQFDKIVHIGLFAVMVWLFCRGHYQSGKPRRTLHWLFINVAVNAVLYGITMEFVQKYFIPNRSFDSGDIVADVAGALIGYGFSYFIYLKGKEA